jgi:Tol biopolymer transport system component
MEPVLLCSGSEKVMSLKHQVWKWIGAGAGFLAGLLTTGCSLLPSLGGRSESVVAEPAMHVPAAAHPAEAAASEAAAASIVNVFGEFNGEHKPVVAVGGEAGFQQHTACDEGYDADVAADPTGKWIVFSSTRHSEHADIYLQRVEGTSVIQLTSDPAADVQPVFSPDGKRIAFSSARSGNWDLYVMDIDGRNVEQVANTVAQEMHPSFSPDGTRLAYCALSPRSEQWELWVINLSTREKKTIGAGLFPSWSPQKDVDRIAFQRPRQRGSRWFGLWTVDLVNGEPMRVTEIAASANAAVVSPSWSPDGKRLAFATIVQAASSQQTSGPQDLWMVSSDGGSRQRLTQGQGTNLSPAWAVDNRIYFISDRSGHDNVWSVRVESGKVFTAAGEKEPGASGQQAKTE